MQVPDYEDKAKLEAVEKQLGRLPAAGVCRRGPQAEAQAGQVAEGKGFLLQGGDCAESFAEHSADNIRDFFRVFLQMAVVLTFAGGQPVVKVGRIAGQFAKPRSSPTEVIDGIELPIYRGDIVNGAEATLEARRPDPERQIMAYRQSAATLNLLRAFAQGGYANLEHVHKWTLGFLKDSPAYERYQELSDRITEALGFMRACGINADTAPQLRQTDFFTSHEALLLGYEQALTRVDSTTGDWYATSGHMLWIGDRTRQPDHAHVEFCRGIQQPDRPQVRPVAQARRSDPPDRQAEPGERAGPPHAHRPLRRRQGGEAPARPDPRGEARRPHRRLVLRPDARQHDQVDQRLQDASLRCDPLRGAPLHGVHQAEGTHAGGIHVEMTGKDVTECTGGLRALRDEDLNDRYHTFCDPRLNAAQALELSFLVAEEIKKEMASRPRVEDEDSVEAAE